MCVIAFSPKGNEAPTEEQIKQMFKKNPDGAGYAWENGSQVHFKKGFMNVDDLLEDLGPLDKWTDRNLAIHFRIGTAGKNDKKTTHPFPISNNFGELRKLEGDGPVLFHNGVITGFGGIIDPLASDTQDFVAGVASKMLTRPNNPSRIVEKAIDTIIGSSRLLLMYGKNKVVKFGEWKTKDGNFYSNLLWEPYKYQYPTTYSEDYYKDWYDKTEPTVSDYAWPSMYHQWIKVTPERGKQIMTQATLGDDGYFRLTSTKNIKWDTNMDLTEWWSVPTGKKLKDDIEAELEEDDYDSILETDYMTFNSEAEMEHWAQQGLVFDDNTVELYGVTWYMDILTLEAFTDNSIKMLTCSTDLETTKEVLKLTGHLAQDDDELWEMISEYKLEEKLGFVPTLQEANENISD